MRGDRHGHALRLTLDRPQARNALDPATMAALGAAVRVIEGDGTIRLVQLAAEGTVWCAGADLAAIAAHPGGRGAAMHEFADLLADLVDCAVPVVALVDGAVIGGGVGLLCAADLVVMSPRATLSLPEAGVGLWPMMVGALLGRVMSPRRAMELALTGRKLSAAESVDWGLASRVAPDVEAEASTLTAAITRQAPAAVRAGRAAWRAHAGAEPPDLRRRLHALADALDALVGLPEAAEGITAFFEKRPPVW